MKPHTQQRIFLTSYIFNLQPLLKLCEKLFGQLCSSLVLRLRWGLRLKENIQEFLTHHALPASRTSLIVTVKEFLGSKRFCVGVALVIIGVLLKHVYQVFDSSAIFSKDWYYQNMYWYFWTIRSQMKDVVLSVGIFLLFPRKMKLRYIVFLNMFGSAIEIMHYTFYAVDYLTFHMPATWTIKLIGFFIPAFLLKISDYMLYRKYHIKHGSIARIFGIAKAPNLPAEMKLEIINKEEEVINNFYAKY